MYGYVGEGMHLALFFLRKRLFLRKGSQQQPAPVPGEGSRGIDGHGKREKFLILGNLLLWEITHFPILGYFNKSPFWGSSPFPN